MKENFTTLPTYYLARGRHLDPSSVLSQVCIQGDHSGRLQPLVDLVPTVQTVLAAIGPLLQLPTAQVG